MSLLDRVLLVLNWLIMVTGGTVAKKTRIKSLTTLLPSSTSLMTKIPPPTPLSFSLLLAMLDLQLKLKLQESSRQYTRKAEQIYDLNKVLEEVQSYA